MKSRLLAIDDETAVPDSLKIILAYGDYACFLVSPGRIASSLSAVLAQTRSNLMSRYPGWAASRDSATAKEIDISRSNLYKKLEQYKISQESDS